jgi:transposase
MSTKKIDDSIKQKVIRDYDNGLSMVKIAEKYGISRSSVGRIVKSSTLKKDKQHPEPDRNSRERQRKIEDLEKRILELEKKILEMEQRRR